MAAPNILIALTAYGGWTRNLCVNSIVGLVQAIIRNGWQHTFVTIEQNDIAQARNTVATYVLENKTFTHLLFVDYDMVFRPQVALRLISSELPIVGAAYLRRKSSHMIAENFAVELDAQMPEPKNGVIEVKGIGMGLTAIDRKTLDALHSTGKLTVTREGRLSAWNMIDATRHVQDSQTAVGFFDRMIIDDAIVSEDLSFCRRWKEFCGGAAYAVIDDSVGHISDRTLSGRMIDLIRTS